MEAFSGRVFGYAFGIALGIAFAVALTLVVAWNALSALSVLVAVLASLGISVAIAALIAGYRLPLVWSTRAYRAVMRRLARRAIRSSIAYAMTRVECLGILEIEGDVAIRVQAGQSQGVKEGTYFNVYEATDNRLWGVVRAVDVRDFDCDCIPYDMINPYFWEELENRVNTDTSKPANVYLVRDLPEAEIISTLAGLLDNWR